MKRKRSTGLPAITAEQARQALQVLIADGRIAAREVSRALARREKIVRELRQRLSVLGEEITRAASGARLTAREKKALRRGARRAITQAQLAARRAQGQYLAAIRGLSKASRAKIREIRKSSGVQAAIAAARKLAG